MDSKYLAATPMLNYNALEIQTLIKEKGWQTLDDFHKIGAIYDFVQNDILFGYNEDDSIPATQVLADGIGQCNTKATLLMALLRGVHIPTRFRAFKLTKAVQKGAVSPFLTPLAPKDIVHTWAEVYYNEKWCALEGVITDKAYIKALQEKYSSVKTYFVGYGVGTDCFSNPPIDWKGTDTFIQKQGIHFEYGIYDCPDDFFSTHSQALSPIKFWIYRHIVRHMMTRSLDRIRRG